MKHLQNPQGPAPKTTTSPDRKTAADPASQSRFAASEPQPHEQSFRTFIKSRLPRHKPSADLIQAIKASIRKAE